MLKTVRHKDGFHLLDAEKYHDLNAVRNSWLEQMRRSPAACRLAMDADDSAKDTKALRVGRALHSAVLEPLSFLAQFKKLIHKGTTKEGKAERAKLEGTASTGLNTAEWNSMVGMADSLRTHPEISKLIAAATVSESTAIWTRADRRCKARLDLLKKDAWVLDIKSTRSIERFSPYSVTEYGYARQAAWYLSCFQFLYLPIPDHFYFAVVCSAPPYESGLFRIDRESVATGIDETNQAFSKFLACEREKTWTRHLSGLMVARTFPPREAATTSSK